VLSSIIVLLKLEVVSAAASATTSDYGKFTMRASGADEHIYFTDEIESYDKLHVAVSVPNCNCIGSVDVQKINQFDYFAIKNYIYSFSIYVHSEISTKTIPSLCRLNAMEIQARTELSFNTLGTIVLSRSAELNGKRQESNGNVTIDQSSFLPVTIPLAEEPAEDYYMTHAPDTSRIEGMTLLNAIAGYMSHSYVKSNEAKILHRGGGILLIQGNVELRPCMLKAKMDTPWILNDFEQRHQIKYTQKSTAVRYYTKDDVEIFNGLLDEMTADGLLTAGHMAKLKTNNEVGLTMWTFPFQALYVPYDDMWVVAQFLEYFVDSGLSPFIYMPFIYQIMWIEKYDWEYYTRADNFTMRVGEPLLRSCNGATIKETIERVDTAAAQGLFYYAATGCSSGLDVEYVFKKAKLMGVYLFYEIMFWIMFSFGCLSCLCICRERVRRFICCWCHPKGYRLLIDMDAKDAKPDTIHNI
jgi:hypothetical protein